MQHVLRGPPDSLSLSSTRVPRSELPDRPSPSASDSGVVVDSDAGVVGTDAGPARVAGRNPRIGAAAAGIVNVAVIGCIPLRFQRLFEGRICYARKANAYYNVKIATLAYRKRLILLRS